MKDIMEYMEAHYFQTKKNVSFTGDGTETSFVVTDKPATLDSVKVDGIEVTTEVTYTAGTGTILFSTAPANNADIIAEYSVIELGGVITSLTENSNLKETEKQYIHEKESRTTVTGYANEFPITMDMVDGDAVFDDFYENIFYKRATGDDAKRDHYIVKLWKPTGSNTYECRKINQTVEISDATGDAGAQKQISGSLKGGSFEYGTFNTSTKAFTPNN